MTEAEAKKKICHKTLGREIANPEPCVASECMAWRWLNFNRLGEMVSGHCGLAGAPQ